MRRAAAAVSDVYLVFPVRFPLRLRGEGGKLPPTHLTAAASGRDSPGAVRISRHDEVSQLVPHPELPLFLPAAAAAAAAAACLSISASSSIFRLCVRSLSLSLSPSGEDCTLAEESRYIPLGSRSVGPSVRPSVRACVLCMG